MAKQLIQKIYRNKVIFFESVAVFFLIVISFLVLLINFKEFRREDIKLIFTGETPDSNTLSRKICYISGQVNNPGVYEFAEDTRLAELVELAGGFTDKADLEFINKNSNLSEKVKDEYFIYIPSTEERNSSSANGITLPTEDKVSINSASETELDTLPGVGPSTAQKIIGGRPYATIEELLNVDGIGDSKFNDIKNLISI